MSIEKLTRYWIACLTALSILFVNLTPLISVELAKFNDSTHFLIEICSVTKSIPGITTYQKNGDNLPAPTETSSHLTHCPFCLSHSLLLSLLPASKYVIPVIKNSHVLPSLFYQTARLFFIWAAPQSRAPPFSS